LSHRDPAAGETLRIVRVIARLNIGGPAIQVITLTRELEPYGFHTTLVRGVEENDEGSMDDLARELGVTPVRVPWLRRNPGWHDLRGLLALVAIIRRTRPHVVHTHAAKAGTLGRVAAVIASIGRRRPVIVHTFHGHSLSGYFSPRTTAIYRATERLLARFSDRLIAVSAEVRDDLVRFGVAPESKFTVVPLGFDLSPLASDEGTRARARSAVRSQLRIGDEERVVTLVARLVPIKRVDRFLRVAAALRDEPAIRFVIVGDGELRDNLRGTPEARALGERLIWTGFRRDMPAIYHASDIVVQTSDNEGTPVSLIEAQAGGLPVVTTDVGGTASVVEHERTGLLVGRDDDLGLARAVRTLHRDPALSARLGAAGRDRSLSRFGLDRLVADLLDVYRAELARR
jgi:glycosyltransferase involved in cell wall biosynthesis